MTGLLILFAVALAIIIVCGTMGLVYRITHPKRKTLAIALARGNATDPAELDLEAEAVVWTLTEGVESPGWIIAGQNPQAPAMIMVHGHRNSRYGSLQRAKRFAAYASKVIVFDLPGHGDAVGGRCTLGVHEPADVAAVIEQLGEPRVVVFGSSLGAGIAIATGARFSSRIAGVMVEGPFRHWHDPIRRIMQAKRYPAQPFLTLTGWVLRVKGIRFDDYDRVALARELQCPLLVLHGEQDLICPFETGKAIAAAAPQGELVAFEEGQHQDLAEVDQVRYLEAVARFFRLLDRPV